MKAEDLMASWPQILIYLRSKLPALSTIEEVLKVLAIVIGGVWTYYKFIQGRTIHPLLELKISGRVIRRDDRVWVLCSLEAKNVHVSVVHVDYSALRLSSCGKYTEYPEALPVIWNKLVTVAVFEGHREIWPGETVREETLLSAPPNQRAFRLELRVARKTKRKRWFAQKKIPWYAQTIIET